jgi:hypothetical protein
MNATQDQDRGGGSGGAAADPAELLEQLFPGPVTPGQLEDIFQQFKKAFVQQALGRRDEPSPGLCAKSDQAQRGKQRKRPANTG